MVVCPFRRVTGRPCPACGVTRASVALLRGDVVGGYRQHSVWTVAALATAAASIGSIVSGHGSGFEQVTTRWRQSSRATRLAVGGSAVTAVWWWNIRRW